MNYDWMKGFANLYFFGEKREAYRYKSTYIPNKLYKYQSFSERNIETIKNNNLWFANAQNLNDPFDCKATFYNEQELIKDFGNAQKTDEKKELLNKLFDELQRLARITCFTEDPFNMPMWAHYGDNHQGICVEYDFTQLPIDNRLLNGLFPVGYENTRYDITNLLKMVVQESNNPKIDLLYFLMLLKHKSWSYEKEWRILLYDDNQKGQLEHIPIKPTAIYFGLNSSEENIKKIKSQLDKDIKFTKLTMHNNEFFNFNIEELKL